MFSIYRLLFLFPSFCQVPWSGGVKPSVLVQLESLFWPGGSCWFVGAPGVPRHFPVQALGAERAEALWHCTGCLLAAFVLQKTAVYVPLLPASASLAQTIRLMLRFSSLCGGRTGALSTGRMDTTRISPLPHDTYQRLVLKAFPLFHSKLISGENCWKRCSLNLQTQVL